MNWISDMFEGKDAEIKKKAELTNQETEWERKIEANDWVKDVMSIDETAVNQEAANAQAADEGAAGIDDIMRWEEGDMDESNEAAMFQKMINDGSVWRMPGSSGRRAMELLRAGLCELGEQRFQDAYGNTVPSKHDVKPGTTGAPLETRNQDIESAAPTGDPRMSEAVTLLKKTYGIDPNDVDLEQWLSSDTTTPVADLIQQIGEKYDLAPVTDTWAFNSFFNLKKTAAYTRGDTAEETVTKDYELGVSGLSDYNLAEMLAEYSCLENNTATLNLNEEKESQLKSVKSGRDASEKKLLKYLGDHTLIDWKKSFKAMEDSEVKHAGEKDLYSTWKEGKMAWDKDTKFDAPSDKEKLEQMEGVGKEEEKGQVGKEAGKTEFVKCPTCDSVAARKHEDGSVTCVTCDHGKTDKKAALKSVEEKVEKKLNQLIDQKLEEAFNPAPEMPAVMPTDVAPIIDAPKPEEAPVEEPKKKEDEKEASLKKADFPADMAPANDTMPIEQAPETPLSQELGLDDDAPVSATELTDAPVDAPMAEPTLDAPADPAQATLDALKSSLDALEVLVKDKPELHALIEETENKIFEIEKSLTGGVSVSPEEIMEPEHKDVLETPAPEKKDEPKKDKPEEKKDEKKEEKKDDKKEEKSDEKKDDKEIESQASKKDVIAKVAEIASPWRVIKNDKGEEVIARISPLHTEKKSKEQEVKKDIHSQDVR